MSQILRLAGKIGVTSFRTSEKPNICESCRILRHGLQEYSSQARFQQNTNSIGKTRWKKKQKKEGVSDKEQLHEQLSNTLDARVEQLSHTTGRRMVQHKVRSDTDSASQFINKDKRFTRHMSEVRTMHTSDTDLTHKHSSSRDHADQYSKIRHSDKSRNRTMKGRDVVNADLLSEDRVFDRVDKVKVKSSEKFKQDLLDIIRKGKTPSVTPSVGSQHTPRNSNAENVEQSFRKLPVKAPKPLYESRMIKKGRRDALNQIYERKNDKIQKKDETLKAKLDEEENKKSVFDTIYRKNSKSTLVMNPEYREGLADAKNLFEYKSDNNLNASDVKAAVGLIDVLYDNPYSHSAFTDGVSHSAFTDNVSHSAFTDGVSHSAFTDNVSHSAFTDGVETTIDQETEIVDADIIEKDIEENDVDAEYSKIDVSDAEWDVLKKIRKRKSKFVATLGEEEVSERERFNDPFHEETSMSNSVGLEDVTVTDWMESYKPIEGVLTEKAKKNKRQKQHKDINLLKDGLIQEQVLIEMFNMDLKSYVEACIPSGMTMRALEDVKFYRNSPKHYHKITDINIYNTILRGLGKEMKGLDLVREVFSYIKEDGIQPNIQTYSICLSCIGKSSTYDLLIASFIVKDMIKLGIDVRDIFNQCTFVHNERAGVYKMLKKLIPGYEPYPPKPTLPYTGTLVEPLNEPLPLVQKVDVNPFACDMKKEELMKAAHQQFSRELDQIVHVESVFKTHSKMDDVKAKEIDKMKEQWRTSIKEAFLTERANLLTKARSKVGITMYPFFCLFPVDDYVDILCTELESWAVMSQGFSPSVMRLQKTLAERIHKRFVIQKMIDGDNFVKLQKAYSMYIDQLCDESTPIQRQSECWRRITETFSDGNSMEKPNIVWSQSIINELGVMMYRFLIENAEVNSNVFTKKPEKMAKAFFEVVRQRYQDIGTELRPHPVLSTLMNAQSDLSFNVNELPSLSPPVPYTSSTQGGNFTSTIDIVRWCSDRQLSMFNDKLEDCGPVLDSLNVLSTYAWNINKPVLDVILKVFKEGGNAELDIPVFPDNLPKPERPPQTDSSYKEDMKLYLTQQKAYQKQFMEATSLWWSGLFKLSIAQQFRDKTFWIPMNMDFRGRTYAVPAHLNHQGQDFVRALMMFAKGKPLGDNGLDWLKLQLINLTELMKNSTFEEKLLYADEIMEDILDSADNPLTGNKWWMKSESPWQTLGVCMEIAAAYKSGDPCTYISHYPIHQDGSCNGLQHFSALGRDEGGAKSVNLISVERPADVYSDVVELVRKEIEHDIAENNEYANIAKICKPYLARKVIKQSIMTTVYGVTEYGARQQIQKRLKEKDFPEELITDARQYLTTTTFKSLNKLFVSARQIQEWFDRCSKAIAEQNETVDWNTPLNFPCIQPYFDGFNKPPDMPEKLYSFLKLDGKHIFRKVNSRKQKNGFSPNFIHSLDSVHMMLTCLNCYRHGLTYSSVHDSYWTHASDVDIMNKVTREQFIALHEQPILENLSQHFIEIYLKQGNLSSTEHQKLMNIFTALPERGNLDLKTTVLNSRYFFS